MRGLCRRRCGKKTTLQEGENIMKRAAVLWLAFICAICANGVAQAQDYPTHPIKVLVGFPAGSGADIIARFFASKIQAAAGQTVIVENRPGANGNIAMGLATKAKPDGYTILFSSNSTILAGDLLYKDLGFDPQKDLTPAALFSETTFILVVPSSSPVKSVAELTGALKANPRNKFGYANQTSQVSAEYYKATAGFQSVPVSYRSGSDALNDLSSGSLDFVIIDGTFGNSQVKAGKVRALAVTTKQRHSVLPDTPTMQELGMSDFDFSAWWGAYLPTGTSPQIIAQIGRWFNAASAGEDTRLFLDKVTGIPLNADAEGAKARIAQESARWRKAIQAAGIEPQ
jgi:tripartite-type tricarboxylate transporter receptor subunit TctC